jgi:hypothetical protein
LIFLEVASMMREYFYKDLVVEKERHDECSKKKNSKYLADVLTTA